MKPIHSLALCAGLLTLSACQSQTDTLSLAGEWRFAIDSLDRGQAESWAARPLEGTLHLPGSLQEQGYGDNVSVKTPWTGQIVDQSWYTAPEYAKYREPGNIKVPFWLNPDKHYVGAAWYQRTVDIPEDWQGRPVELELERTHWTTDLYLDGRKVDSRESLQTPHRYVFPDGLAPGTHTLTLRVDNRLAVGGKNPEVAVVATEFPKEPIETQGPKALMRTVLKNVGCSHHRDSFDAAVVEQVRTGTAPWGDNGFIDTPSDCGGLPALAEGKPAPDLNRNGIPDALESRFSDIEDYLNWLVR